MKINAMPPYNPSMGWNIASQTTKYGKNMVKCTTYYPDSGFRLVVTEKSRLGKLVSKEKALFDGNWKLIKKKFIGGKNV